MTKIEADIVGKAAGGRGRENVSVYVDDAQLPYGRMIMCHMIADDHLELLSMACRIGVPSKWIQKRGTYQEHFDICLAMRKRAVERGAIEITDQELGIKLRQRRRAVPPPVSLRAEEEKK